MIAGFYFFSFV